MVDLGTRTDCTRDNQKTICVNSMHLGFSSNVAKRGSWIRYEIDNHSFVGRVVGRVHCEGKTYLEIITTDVAMTMAYVRWINPASVRECYLDGPHKSVMAFLTGEWDNAETVLARAARGFVYERKADVSPDRSRFSDGYDRARSVEQVPSEQRDGMSPAEWFAHQSNRPMLSDREDFRNGYIKRMRQIAERDGWTPIWPAPEATCAT